MDTGSFFIYPDGGGEVPTPAAAPTAPMAAGLLPEATEDEWQAILAWTQTLRFRTGEQPIRAGVRDRAFYLLADGRLQIGDAGALIDAPATVGEGAFLDGGTRAVTLTAITDGELLRLSWEDWEALSARKPKLGRDLVADLGRIAAQRLRSLGHVDGWTG